MKFKSVKYGKIIPYFALIRATKIEFGKQPTWLSRLERVLGKDEVSGSIPLVGFPVINK